MFNGGLLCIFGFLICFGALLFFGMVFAIINGMKINNKKTAELKIRIEPSLMEQLKNFAIKQKVMYSKIVRIAIKRYIDHKEG